MMTKDSFLRITRAEVADIQFAFGYWFNWIAKRELWSGSFINLTRLDDAILFLHVNQDLQFIPVFAAEDVKAAAKTALTFHLAGSGLTADDIRLCERPKCQSLFLRSRKGQMYCSKKCAQEVASANYEIRNRPEVRATERKRGRDQYEKKQKAKLGKGTIIGKTRPRLP
jgi:hypothetical protein